MKKILAIMAMVASVLFTGCDKTPTVETMETTANAVGRAAGYVANQTKIDEKSREVVIEIMNKATNAVPQAGQSFTDAWTPIAKEVTDKLVAEKKIDEGQALIINGAFGVAVRGLDYLVTVRFPKAKEDVDLVAAGARGFSKGFLDVFSAKDNALKSGATDYDKAAYDYLMSQGKSK